MSRIVPAAIVAAVVVLAAGAAAGAGLEAGDALRVAVIADINSSYGTVGYSPQVHTAIARIVALEPDLVLGLGDLIAGQRRAPRLQRAELEAMWAAFDAEVGGPLRNAGIPFAPVPGNHDASAGQGFALEREVFDAHWQGHRPAVDLVDAEGYPFRYGFAVDGVLFVVLDATTVGPIPDEQRSWVAELLARSSMRRARVVAAHLPLVPFSHGREREVLGDAALERLLSDRRVDLFLSGHHHAFFPGYRAGFRQVSQGCLGSGPRRLLGQPDRAPRSFTVVDVAGDGRLEVAALSGPSFGDPVDRGSLPRVVTFGGVKVVRDDLAERSAPPGSMGRDALIEAIFDHSGNVPVR